MSDALREQLRRQDFAARIGGDEFAVLLPETGDEGAQRLGERLAQHLCERGPAERALGLSFGVAVPGQDGETLDELMGAADQALYRAKRSAGVRVRRSPAVAPCRTSTAVPAPGSG